MVVAVVEIGIECAVVKSRRGGWGFGSLGFRLGFLHGCWCRCRLRWQMNHAARDGAAVKVFLLLEIHFP